MKIPSEMLERISTAKARPKVLTFDDRRQLLAEAVDATKRQIAIDTKNGILPKITHEPQVWLKWAKEWFSANGFDAASSDCCLANLRKYVQIIASEYLIKASGTWPAIPEFAHPAFLEGDDETNYWRAIAIIRNLKE